MPSISKIRKDLTGVRENGRENSITQGCVLCVLTMQKETETPEVVVSRGRAQKVTHTKCCRLILRQLSCLCGWCPVTHSLHGDFRAALLSAPPPLIFFMLLKDQVYIPGARLFAISSH